MGGKKFPNHEGGVIHVQHSERWGAVPEALLEDARLGLDSRTVAAWLAVKPSGWQIIIDVLQRRLGTLVDPGDGETVAYRALSRERWRRIAKELELAGYLKREVTHGRGGRWIWHITFNPRPAVANLAVAGFPGSGRSSDGRTGDGNCNDKTTPLEIKVTKTTTTERAGNVCSADAPKQPQQLAKLSVDGYAGKHQDIRKR